MMKRFCIVATVILCLAGVSEAETFSGTVNVVLANSNGIVVLTDSLLTGERNGVQVRLPGQKLFVLDDKTVGTLAGLAATRSVDFQDVFIRSAEIFRRYSEELHTSSGPKLSFGDKATGLELLFEFYLFGMGNVEGLNAVQASNYEVELIVAGYDIDGKAKIRKFVLRPVVVHGVLNVVPEPAKERTVNGALQHESAGIAAPTVERIMAQPHRFATQPAIGAYASRPDHGATLTTFEMQDLAKALGRYAAEAYPKYIDDNFQVAVLRKDKPIDRSGFEEPRTPNMTNFHVFSGLSIDGVGVPGVEAFGRIPPGTIVLFLKMDLKRVLVEMDNGIYTGDQFAKSVLTYDGGALRFENNKVEQCELVLGPHANQNPKAVSNLLKKYRWEKISGEVGQRHNIR